MTLHAPLYPAGTRVTVRRGRLPLSPGLAGRSGTVIQVDDYRPGRYAVQLDGEDTVREFAQDELEAAAAPT